MKPDLILMDIQLPEISWMEVTKWLEQEVDLK
jgi:CheY-like chemotaxis protein